MTYRKELLVFADLDRATLRSEYSGEEFALASRALGSHISGFDPGRMVKTLHRFRDEGRSFDPNMYFELHGLDKRQIGRIMRSYVRGDYTIGQERGSMVYPDAQRLLSRIENSPSADLCFITRGKPVPQRVKLYRERLGRHYSVVVSDVQKGQHISELKQDDGWHLPRPFANNAVYNEAMFFDDLGEAHVGVPEDVYRYCIDRVEGGKTLLGGQVRVPGVVFIESLDEITHPALGSYVHSSPYPAACRVE